MDTPTITEPREWIFFLRDLSPVVPSLCPSALLLLALSFKPLGGPLLWHTGKLDRFSINAPPRLWEHTRLYPTCTYTIRMHAFEMSKKFFFIPGRLDTLTSKHSHANCVWVLYLWLQKEGQGRVRRYWGFGSTLWVCVGGKWWVHCGSASRLPHHRLRWVKPFLKAAVSGCLSDTSRAARSDHRRPRLFKYAEETGFRAKARIS